MLPPDDRHSDDCRPDDRRPAPGIRSPGRPPPDGRANCRHIRLAAATSDRKPGKSAIVGLAQRLLVLAVFIVALSGLPAQAAAAPTERSPSPAPPQPPGADALPAEQTERLPLAEIERYWDALLSEYGAYFPDKGAPSFKELIAPDGGGVSLAGTIKGLFRFFFHEIVANGKLLAVLVVLAVFHMILESIQSAFERNTVSKVAFAITYLVLIVIAVNSFSSAIGYARQAIEGMVHFMVSMIPLLLTLLASTGSVVSVAVLHPLLIFMVNVVGTAIYLVVFPLLFFSTLLHIVSAISDRYKLTQLADLLRNVGVGLLGLLVTVFLGVVSVQGATGAVADGVALKAAKYVTGNFVPVVGRMFADASDTVIGASLLVKNAVGLAGVIVLIMLCAFPAVKILTLALIYHVSAAVLQPLGDSPIAACLQSIGKGMIYVFAALAAVSLLFFLAITIMIAAGNVTVMVR